MKKQRGAKTVPESNSLKKHVPKDPLMAGPWSVAISVALRDASMLAGFKTDTGLSWNPPKSPLDRMIDEATGADMKFLVAFAAWFNENIWGDPDLKANVSDELRRSLLSGDLRIPKDLPE